MERNAVGSVNWLFFRSLRGRLLGCASGTIYLHNARGDVVSIIRLGTVLRIYRYSAFGVELYPAVNDFNRFRFGGEYWDAHRGEYYLRARSFNPRLGRFTQADPFFHMRFGQARMMGSPNAIAQAGNLFVFVMNNPVMWRDPTGLFAQPNNYLHLQSSNSFICYTAFAHWVRTGERIEPIWTPTQSQTPASTPTSTPASRPSIGIASSSSVATFIPCSSSSVSTPAAVAPPSLPALINMSNSSVIGGVVAWVCPTWAIKLFEVVKKYGPKASQQVVNTTSRVWNAVSGLFSRGGATPMSPAEAARIIPNAQRVGRALENDTFHRAGAFLTESQLAKGTTSFLRPLA